MSTAPVWEQRWHPLRREWVVVASHRQHRPWLGQRVAMPHGGVPAHDPDCRFCPRSARVSGIQNPDYASTLVFDNDAPCVGPGAPTELEEPAGIYRNRPASGVARVVCYSPRHDLSLAELAPTGAVECLAVLAAQYRELGAMAGVEHVLAFENRGAMVGVSNPHPHCQIYATNFVFTTIEREVEAGREHLARTGRVLFQDVLDAERADGRRILFENDSAIAFLPYFARYPYEVFVAPKATHPSLTALSDAELADFAAALQNILIRYDNLWRNPFPYVMPLHQAPTDGGDHRAFHFHAELYPPLRLPDVPKIPAGPELGGGNYLTDTCPEETAAELRAVGDVHYKAATL